VTAIGVGTGEYSSSWLSRTRDRYRNVTKTLSFKNVRVLNATWRVRRKRRLQWCVSRFMRSKYNGPVAKSSKHAKQCYRYGSRCAEWITRWYPLSRFDRTPWNAREKCRKTLWFFVFTMFCLRGGVVRERRTTSRDCLRWIAFRTKTTTEQKTIIFERVNK